MKSFYCAKLLHYVCIKFSLTTRGQCGKPREVCVPAKDTLSVLKPNRNGSQKGNKGPSKSLGTLLGGLSLLLLFVKSEGRRTRIKLLFIGRILL